MRSSTARGSRTGDQWSTVRFPAGDADALAALIVELSDPAARGAREALARGGRVLIESRYGMDGVVDALAEAYRGGR